MSEKKLKNFYIKCDGKQARKQHFLRSSKNQIAYTNPAFYRIYGHLLKDDVRYIFKSYDIFYNYVINIPLKKLADII